MKQNKINIKVIAIIIYFILSVSMLIYQKYATAKVVEKADRVIQRHKQYSQTVQAEQSFTPQENLPINAPVEEERYKESVPSTDLFLKAVQAEKGDTQQQAQPQILDYGSQVAAYEAQAKAQREAAVRQTVAPQANTTSVPSRQTGAAAVANKNPASLIQPEKQQETKLNKLETRRIFK